MMRRLALFALPMLAASCAAPADDGYPSLLPRPIERRGFAEPETPPPPVADRDPALELEIDRERGALGQAWTAFEARAAEAERLAARAGNAAPGSEAWIAAQVALADLDTLRSGTAGTLADIERLAIDRASEGKPAYPALESLLADARAQNAGEVERIARIEGMMKRA